MLIGHNFDEKPDFYDHRLSVCSYKEDFCINLF